MSRYVLPPFRCIAIVSYRHSLLQFCSVLYFLKTLGVGVLCVLLVKPNALPSH